MTSRSPTATRRSTWPTSPRPPTNGDFFGHDHVEGLISRDNGRTLILANDSDFGLAGLANASPPFALKPKMLPNGTQDSGEILVVDTTKLPATTESVTVPIKIG
jgi:hypothetical protein